MRCLMCGAEMQLVHVVKDDTMFVPGYEHHTWQCSACPEVERRLVFIRENTSAENVSVGPTRPEAPASKLEISAQPVENIRGTQTELKEQAAIAGDTERLSTPVEPVQSATGRIASQAPTEHGERTAAPQSAWKRAIAKLCRRQESGL
jgi:hypothetical protein